ncbi:MAG: hypothetical protein ABIJ14_04030 [Nanoarchaeota archaeon]
MARLTRRQKGLIEKLVGQEAKRSGRGPPKLYRHIVDKTKAHIDSSPEKTKREIYESFPSNCFDSDLVRRYMILYTKEQEKIARGVNESFEFLLGIYRSREYDFDFSRFVEGGDLVDEYK